MDQTGVQVQSDKRTVQLGCGTLILIAIIVAIFSGDNSDRKLRKEVGELHEKIDRLERKIDALSASRPAGEVPATATTSDTAASDTASTATE